MIDSNDDLRCSGGSFIQCGLIIKPFLPSFRKRIEEMILVPSIPYRVSVTIKQTGGNMKCTYNSVSSSTVFVSGGVRPSV